MPSDFGKQHVAPTYLRRFMTAPAVRVTILLSFILICWYEYGKTNFYRDPGSRFYDEDRAYDRRYSAYREEQALAYLKSVEEDGVEHPKADANATICASFLTVNRPGTEPYLDASIGSALDRLTPAERRSMHLSVFFATIDPNDHATYHRPWLRKVVDEVNTYEDVLSPSDIDHVHDLEEAKDGLRKAPYDYTLPLRLCEDTKAKYYLIFEDDVILSEGWLSRTLLGLQEMEKKLKASHRKGEWLYMRLFSQERSTGWGSKEVGGNHEAKVSAWIGTGLGLFLLLMRRRSRSIRTRLDIWTILIVCVVFTPLYVILFFQSGKASMLPPKPGAVEELAGDCAQGLVFNKIHVDSLVEFLYMKRHEGFHDLLMRDYARMQGFSLWSLYPSVVQHVGIHSTIQKIFFDAKKAWSMAFEDQDPLQLARQHGENVRKYFGDWAVG